MQVEGLKDLELAALLGGQLVHPHGAIVGTERNHVGVRGRGVRREPADFLNFACLSQELPLLAVRHALPDAQFPVEACGGYELALGLGEDDAVDRVLVSLQCKDALQALALAGLCCLGHGCDVDNVANVVAAAGCNDLGVHGVLCYAEDRVLMLVEMRYRVVLQVDLHLNVVITLLIAVHRNIAVIFDDLLGLFCVEYVILVVVIDLGLVVG